LIDFKFSKVFSSSDLQQNIDRLSFWQADRLLEEDIENTQDLATKEIPGLLIRTRLGTQRILQWVDQALLCSQIEHPEQIQLLKQAGIHTACDLLDIYRTKDKGLPHIMQSLEPLQPSDNKPLMITPFMLENVIIALERGPNLPYIRTYWENTRTTKSRAHVLSGLQLDDQGRVGEGDTRPAVSSSALQRQENITAIAQAECDQAASADTLPKEQQNFPEKS